MSSGLFAGGPWPGKFGDGQTSFVREVKVRLGPEGVTVTDAKTASRVAHWRLTDLEVDWTRRDSVEVRARSHPDAYVEVESPEFRAELRRQMRSLLHGDRNRVATFLSLLLLAIGVAMGAYLLANPLSKWVARKIPMEWEGKLAARSKEIFSKEYCGEEVAPPLLQKLVRKLQKGGTDPVVFEVHLIREEIPNAFAMPGGFIVITSGFLDEAESPDELAGVLAHEMSHVYHRHMTTSLVRSTLLTSLWQVAMGDFTSIMIVDPSTAFEIATLKFDRDAEREADMGAIRMLDRAGISREGFARFFERLPKDGGKLSELLSTHPSHDDRVARIRQGMPKGGHRIAMTLADWTLLKDACRD